MKNKLRLFLGWFGVLTPVYAAGALTVLFVIGESDMPFLGGVALVSAINFLVGRNLLKTMVVEKVVKKRGSITSRG